MISEPEIKIFKINPDHDFIVMGCNLFLLTLGDGIFDKLTS